MKLRTGKNYDEECRYVTENWRNYFLEKESFSEKALPYIAKKYGLSKNDYRSYDTPLPTEKEFDENSLSKRKSEYDSLSDLKNVTYKFHDKVTKMRKGTDGSHGTSATYVEFGDWPQSILDKSSGVTIDTSKKFVFYKHLCYAGSDGNLYVLFNNNYYKIEPIKWCVLDKKYNYARRLLVAEDILTFNAFYTNSGSKRAVDNKQIYDNNYYYSEIREFLNNDFYKAAFTETAQKIILDNEVDNSVKSTSFW